MLAIRLYKNEIFSPQLIHMCRKYASYLVTNLEIFKFYVHDHVHGWLLIEIPLPSLM